MPTSAISWPSATSTAATRRRPRSDPKIGKGKADVYGDYRKVLDRNDIDVVSVVTPDHWHVKIAIEALQAGKHVFCQKPLTLTLEENQLIRNACKAYPKLVFFIGTQQRSDRDRFLRAINMVQKGLLGNIKRVTVGIDGAPTGGPFPVAEPPRELDWDMWLGQAPKVDYRQKRCHYEFRWWYEYSGGKFTDWGRHHVDIATWAIERRQRGHGPDRNRRQRRQAPGAVQERLPDRRRLVQHVARLRREVQVSQRRRNAHHQPRRQRRAVRGHQGPDLREPRQDHRQADRGELGQRPVHARTTWSGSIKASRSKATRKTSTAASAKAGWVSPTSSATCRR